MPWLHHQPDRWWILGHHEEGDVWHPLYCFAPEKRHIARGVLALLLSADEDSKLYLEHVMYDDFKLQPPEGDRTTE